MSATDLTPMTSLQAIRLVAGREMRERARSKAYIIGSIVTTGILLALIVVPAILNAIGGPTTYRIGTVGDGNELIIDSARALDAANTDEDDEPASFEITPFADADQALAAIEAGDVDIALADGSRLITKATSFFGDDDLARLLQEAAGSLLLADLLADNDQAVAVLEALSEEPLEVEVVGDEDTGDSTRAFVAYAGLLLMYIAILTYGAWTLTGVTEEKSSRIVEVLLATIRPWQLLAGKIIGIGILGLAQLIVTIVAGLVAVRITGTVELPDIPLDSILWLIIWFSLGYALYSTMFGATGALVSRMEDAQNASTPISLMAVVGFFISFQVLQTPDSLLATITSFVPVTAPYVVPIRIAFESIAVWEIVLAIAITIAAIVVLIRFAGRVYAGALLRFGGRIKLREAYRSAEI